MNATLIRETRKAKGMTQEQLAQAAGISQNYLSQLESGTRTSTSLDTLKALAAALGITTDALLAEKAVA